MRNWSDVSAPERLVHRHPPAGGHAFRHVGHGDRYRDVDEPMFMHEVAHLSSRHQSVQTSASMLNRHKVALGIVQVALCIVLMLGFFILTAWKAAVPIDQIAPAIVATLPKGCPAAAVGHGKYSCVWGGTSKSSPFLFAICTFAMFLGFALLMFTAVVGVRVAREDE
jgi:hypothetical protein